MNRSVPVRRDRARRWSLALAGLSLVTTLVLVAAPDLSPAGAAPGTATGPGGQALMVSETTIDPAGGTVTVVGEGYDAGAGYDVATDGLYLSLCLDNGPTQAPSPCIGGVDMTGARHSARWITNNPLPGLPPGATVPMAADGSFSTTLDVVPSDEHLDCTAPPAGKACKIFTRVDHRSSGDRSQDVGVAITFGRAAPSGPAVTVTPSTGVDAEGADLLVRGSGYPREGPGLYVVFGPRVTDPTDATPFSPVAFVPSSELGVDGSFEVTLAGVTAVYTDEAGTTHDLSDGGGFVSTFRAHGVPDPTGQWSAEQPVAFAGAAVPASTTTLTASATTVALGAPVVLTAAVTAGDVSVAAGSVAWRDGGDPLGSADLDGTGRATLSTTFTQPGTHQVTAHFAGSDEAGASTSAPIAITVTGAVSPPPPPPPPTEPPTEEPTGTRTGTGPRGQTLTATPVDNLDPTGTEVEVVGRGFDEEAGFDAATDGMYLALCVDRGPGQTPSPCVGGVDVEGGSGTSTWVTNNAYEGVPESAVTPVAPDGSFRATIRVQAADEHVDCLALAAGERCVLATRADHRSSADRSQDVKVPVCFAGEAACATDPIDPVVDAQPEFGGFPLDEDGVESASRSGGGELARTGADVRGLVPWALSLLATGALGVGLRRRSLRAAATAPAPPPAVG